MNIAEAIKILSENPVVFPDMDVQNMWDEAIQLAISTMEKKERNRIATNERQSEYGKRTKYASQARYNKKNTVSFIFRAYAPQDNDIIDYLRSLDNMSGYVKDLIRKDMKRKGL